ncbi:MAG: hypothetical protein EXR31_10415 [Betaproteobacteria bacterium]|nr:hypothetical protein [Betaproteobacteria bacterium]
MRAMTSFGCACSAPVGLGRPTLGVSRTAFAGWYGKAARTDPANPASKARGWYKDDSYGYFYDPAGGIVAYRAGKEVARFEVTSPSYAKAYASMFGPKARHPAWATNRAGAGVPLHVDPKLVIQGIQAAAAVTVAALSAGARTSKKGGRHRHRAPERDAPMQAPSAFPAWTPWAVGAGLLLLVVGVAFGGSGSRAATSAPVSRHPPASTFTSASRAYP